MKTANPSLVLCPFTVVIDVAEKAPYRFDGIPTSGRDRGQQLIVKTEVRSLVTGDYSIDGFEGRMAVERKSLEDLYATIGKHVRQRGKQNNNNEELTTFERELVRLDSLERAAVVVEADWREICRPADSNTYEEKAWETICEAMWQSGCRGGDCQAALLLIGKLLRCRWGSFPAVRKWQSKLHPRSVWGTIFAWQERYPRVHWLMMGSRRLGEIACFEVLERFWRERGAETKKPIAKVGR